MAEPRRARCPVCGKAPERHFMPFCSRRCADVDLGRWFGGVYRVPGPPENAEDENIADQPLIKPR